MIDALLVLAVLCACFGAWKGSRASCALIGSTALTSLLIWAEVPFNIAIWLLIDIAVIGIIATRAMTISDCLIVALFIPAWAFYADPGPPAYEITTLVVSAQLILSAPWRWFTRKTRLRSALPESEGDFLMVAHA